MSIPKRFEEFDDQPDMEVESVHVAGATSWDYIDIREAGFWGDAWNSVTGVGKIVGDVATGNFSNVGKDVKSTARSVNKSVDEGIHDVGQAAKATGNFVKNNWKPIAIGVGMGALALTGVGLLADAGIAAGVGGAALAEGAAAAGAAGAAEGAAVAGGTALAEGAAGAAGAAEAAGTAGAAEAAGTAGAAEAAGAEGAAVEGAGSTATDLAGGAARGVAKGKELVPFKSTLPVAAESDAASGAASGVTKGMELVPFKSTLPAAIESDAAAATTDAAAVTEDAAGAASNVSKFQKAKDLLNKVPGAQTVKKVAPMAATAEGVQTLNAPDAPAAPEPPPPPPPTMPQTNYAPVQTDATLQGQGAPGADQAAESKPLVIQPTVQPVPIPEASTTATDPMSIGQMPLPTASKKRSPSTILDLVEQFGLYPEDIKHSLTSWR